MADESEDAPVEVTVKLNIDEKALFALLQERIRSAAESGKPLGRPVVVVVQVDEERLAADLGVMLAKTAEDVHQQLRADARGHLVGSSFVTAKPR